MSHYVAWSLSTGTPVAEGLMLCTSVNSPFLFKTIPLSLIFAVLQFVTYLSSHLFAGPFCLFLYLLAQLQFEIILLCNYPNSNFWLRT
jgi:hypothetical protein